MWRQAGGRADRASVWPIATALIAGAALALHWLPGVAQVAELDTRGRGPLALVQLWTSHLTHFGGSHLTWDLAMFAVLGLVAERLAPTATRVLLAAGAPLIAVAVIGADPQVLYYRGLSGVDTALFAFLAAHFAIDSEDAGRRRMGRIALALLVARSIYELGSGGTALFVDGAAGGFNTVPIAHVAGAVVGVVTAALAVPVERGTRELRAAWSA